MWQASTTSSCWIPQVWKEARVSGCSGANLVCLFFIMYIIKIKGKAKIPDFIQLRNDDFILIEYFSAERPVNQLRKYGIKSSDKEIIEYIKSLEFGKLQKLNIKWMIIQC